MARRRRTAGRKLTALERWELVFAFGGQCRGVEVHGLAIHAPACNGIGCWSQFETEEERQAAYWSVRDDIMHSLNSPHRPPSFWYYEAGSICTHKPKCPPPAYEDREAWLAHHGLLTPRELADFRKKGSDHE